MSDETDPAHNAKADKLLKKTLEVNVAWSSGSKPFVYVPHKCYEAKFRQIPFSESVRISHGQHLPPTFFSISDFVR